MDTLQIRWMIRRDMPSVLDIEHHSFEFPWSESEFIAVLRKRNAIGLVAELGDEVVGHVVYELHKRTINILNLAVAPERRRRSVATQMMDKLVGKLSSERRNRMVIDVRESNMPAIKFLKQAGFLATAVYRNHYEQTNDDAFHFVYRHHLDVLAEEMSKEAVRG